MEFDRLDAEVIGLAFAETQKVLLTILKHNPTPLTIMKRKSDSEIEYANEAFYSLLGYSKSELTGIKYRRLFDAEDIGRHSKILIEGLKNEDTTQPFDRRLIRKSGVSVWVRTQAFRLSNNFIMTRDIDISAEKVVEAELSRASGLHKDPFPESIRGRQKEVAGLVADGLSSKEIAGRLCLSKLTVDNYRAGLRRDLFVPKGESLSLFLSRYWF